MEVRADAGNGGGIVVDHGKPEADAQDEACELRHVDATPVFAGGEGGLDTEPCQHDGGKGAEEVLPHAHENVGIGIQQCRDRLRMPSRSSWESKTCDPSPPHALPQSLREAGILQRRSHSGRNLIHLRNHVLTLVSVAIDDVGDVIALLLRVDDLLFEFGETKIVGVLQGAEDENVGGVDLVEHTHFGVQRWIIRQRILLQVGNLGLNHRRIRSDVADRLHGVGVDSIPQFHGGEVGDSPLQFGGVHVGNGGRAVGLKGIGGTLITALNYREVNRY